MSIPIACSLDAGAAQDRTTEWRDMLAADVDHVDATTDLVRLRMRPGDDVLLRIVDLAEREQQCCPFFRFGVQLEGGRRWLEIVVPAEAAGILTGLLSPP